MLIAVRSCTQAFLAAAVAFLVMAPQGVAGPARSEAADESACAALTALHVSGTAISQASVVAAGAAVDSGRPTRHGVPPSPSTAWSAAKSVTMSAPTVTAMATASSCDCRSPGVGDCCFRAAAAWTESCVPPSAWSRRVRKRRFPARCRAGYAVVSTDAGHDQSTLAAPGDFGADPQALADYAYNSTRAVTQTALSIAQRVLSAASETHLFHGLFHRRARRVDRRPAISADVRRRDRGHPGLPRDARHGGRGLDQRHIGGDCAAGSERSSVIGAGAQRTGSAPARRRRYWQSATLSTA